MQGSLRIHLGLQHHSAYKKMDVHLIHNNDEGFGSALRDSLYKLVEGTADVELVGRAHCLFFNTGVRLEPQTCYHKKNLKH